MRLTITALGHTLDIHLDGTDAETSAQSEREGSADALIERTNGYDRPAFGFAPSRPEEPT